MLTSANIDTQASIVLSTNPYTCQTQPIIDLIPNIKKPHYKNDACYFVVYMNIDQ